MPVVYQDDWGRTLGNGGWGNADIGGAYSVVEGTANNFSVTGGASGAGINSCVTKGNDRIVVPAGIVNMDLYAKVKLSALPTGANLAIGPTLRMTNPALGGTWYSFRMIFTTAGNIQSVVDKNLSGTFTTVSAATTRVTGYTGGTVVRIHVQVWNTAIRFSIWLDGSPEPAFQVDTTDSSIGDPGSTGWRINSVGLTNSPTVSIDEVVGSGPTAFMSLGESAVSSQQQAFFGTDSFGLLNTSQNQNLVASDTFTESEAGASSISQTGVDSFGFSQNLTTNNVGVDSISFSESATTGANNLFASETFGATASFLGPYVPFPENTFTLLTERAILSQPGASSMTGAGSMVVSGQHFAFGDASTLIGAGSLSTNGTRGRVGQAFLTGTGTLSAAGYANKSGSASLTGTGALSASGTRTRTGAAALTGAGALSASGAKLKSGAAALTGSGTLSATGAKLISGSAALSGTGTLSATGQIVLGKFSGANLSGSGALSASSTHTAFGSAALTGAGTQTTTGFRTRFSSGALTGTGNMNVSTTLRTVVGNAFLSNSSGLVASGTPGFVGAANLTGQGTASVGAFILRFGAARFDGIGFLQVRLIGLHPDLDITSGRRGITVIGSRHRGIDITGTR